MRPAFRFAALAAAAALCLAPAAAVSWGNTGHRIVGTLAIEALPAEVPAFLRSRQAIADMGELAREPDRSKGAGKVHDSNRDPAHYIDLGDTGRVMDGPAFTDMPLTRAEYEASLRAFNTDSWKAGYLQYSIVDAWQQLVKDFAYWRVDAAAEKLARGERKKWYRRDRERREALLMANLGNLAHYVGDGSQPLHTSYHHNGWGDYPNPEGFTSERIHVPWEGPYVKGAVTPQAARAAMPAFADCNCPVEKRVLAYLTHTNGFVVPLYRLWGQGGFKPGDARGAAFATERVGAGAAELRDMIVLAWRASGSAKVGWPEVSVADVEAGRVDPYEALAGKD